MLIAVLFIHFILRHPSTFVKITKIVAFMLTLELKRPLSKLNRGIIARLLRFTGFSVFGLSISCITYLSEDILLTRSRCCLDTIFL